MGAGGSRTSEQGPGGVRSEAGGEIQGANQGIAHRCEGQRAIHIASGVTTSSSPGEI